MSRPGQKPLEALISTIAGLAVIHPDRTVNSSAELMNSCLSELLREILGEEQTQALFEAAITEIGPMLEKEFGLKIVTIASLEAAAQTETDDLLTKLRKGGL